MLKRALTIAGSDSGGGAGIQADLKAFENIGVFGMSAITAVTIQNTLGVQGIHQLPAETVAAQIDAVISDIGVDSVKVGMLGNAAVTAAVAERLAAHDVKYVVVDPVMVATSGDLLLETDAVQTIKEKLLPRAFIVTPNKYEAEILAGIKITGADSVYRAARLIHGLGARGVLIKGGHMDDHEATDVFFDGQKMHTFTLPRVDTRNTHGTGCTLSSAIAAYLCFNPDPAAAVQAAKDYVYRRIAKARDQVLGHGSGPICLPG
ncbi:bifunctional hydroxymethylpyrimidine kinase/phosphomethylpyrimidine kinase [Desulfallas thermosapovorans]|uniref:Hydroxymethylpyrimidine/phosphomethylpyrimidine kinase n=1 Tax=Desulfallas thermosapovorans DSM 6562 TaxID=1121431 RepID=A0A5S4ZYR9_9FIRM|nr:bifunctional hydroxymethylpyrimidine kinase/phosphomethylpyrimidine kinase [Desulfallas thermosapovorans]TYO98005.1 hydroxymethylpyrimidine/phosphomethylpyrimidine kinase/hydroxymethylpyrimidine kinase/phosphomethylpyrimidine kinase/thiamine-phosphate diphosphorylase [Desulfallas thermosapovorans DSM 6562]